ETLPSLPDLSLLKLVGVIETESTRIGLISDGQQEWVVTAGSYLLGTLQVLRVEKVKAIVRFVARSDDMADEYEILMPEL
ncbi:MAG: hypothetical protein R3194_09585, partial [Limnobacter sp.]|nr:hypothetical protein [Limnobacter sp.]